MKNQNTQPTIPAQNPATEPVSTSPAENHSKKKFKIILIGFFVLFFLTIGAAAAIYTFKEVSRSNNNELEQTPSITPQPIIEFEISPNPTDLNTSTECVTAGCSGQLCVSKSESEGLITTCEWNESYACYKNAECKLQDTGKCGWTQTPELQTCLDSAQ